MYSEDKIMAKITLIEKSKTGEEFLKQIALGYRAAMRLRTRDYRSLLASWPGLRGA